MTISSIAKSSSIAFLEKQDSSPIEIGASSASMGTEKKKKSKGKEKIRTIDTKETNLSVSYQEHPIFLQFLFNQTVLPLIKSLQKVGDSQEEQKKHAHLSAEERLLNVELEETSPREEENPKKKRAKNVLEQVRDISALQKVTAQSPCCQLLKGISQQSILLKMETFQLAILRVNLMKVDLDGVPVYSHESRLANRGIKLCVEQLIAKKDKKTTPVWTWQDGKQFLNDTAVLAQQHFNFGCIIPSDHLLYALDTVSYQDPDLEEFIRSTTDDGYETIKKIAWKHKDHIDDEVLDKIIKAADPYFYNELPAAALIFYYEIDRKFKGIKKFGQSYLFRKNTIASVRILKQAERKKHLKLVNSKELPKNHTLEKKDLAIDGVKHKLTIVKEKHGNLAKVITLSKEGSEEVDVYLFVQIVDNPHTEPDPKGESHLLKFDVAPGTNLSWIVEPEANIKQAILNEFNAKKYVPSIYTAMQFKNEIILVEIFKQAGFSLNTRLRAGTAESYLQSLKSKYDSEFKNSLRQIYESVYGASISQYLADCYHNSDLDMEVKTIAGKRDKADRKTVLAKKAIAHHHEEAKNIKKVYLESVRDSILGAMYDNPRKPKKLEASPIHQNAEKIDIGFWIPFFKNASLEKDEVLLALTEIIHDSITHAFDQYKKTEALKMLDLSFEKKESKAILEIESKEEMFLTLFKNILAQDEIELTKGQRELCFKFFQKLSAKRMA